MYSRIAHRFSLRTGLTIVLRVALLALPNIPLLVSGAAQKQNEAPTPKGKPRPGRPEGVLPDLEAIKKESGVKREVPAPIPSTIRSQKNPLQPWNGRRVGDPGAHLGQGVGEGNNLVASNKHRTRLAHARRKMLLPPPVLDDQFIQNFFTWAVSRAPSGTEPTFWNDQFRVAYAQGQTSLKLAAVELGKTCLNRRNMPHAIVTITGTFTISTRRFSCVIRTPRVGLTGKVWYRRMGARTCGALLK